MKWLYDDMITWDSSRIPPPTIICSKMMIVNRHRRFTYKLVDFFFSVRSSVRSSVRPFVRPLYSSLRLFYTGFFLSVCSILHFVFTILDFFFRPSALFFTSWSFFFHTGLFSFVHPIIHFGIGGFFFASVALFFTSSSFLYRLFLYWTFFFCPSYYSLR